MMRIRDIVATYGIKNVRIFMPMQKSESFIDMGLPVALKDSDADYHIVECEIVEDRYKIEDGHKMTVSPVQNDENSRFIFAPEHFYQSDFESMRRRTPEDYRIFILVDEDAKYERLRDCDKAAA